MSSILRYYLLKHFINASLAFSLVLALLFLVFDILAQSDSILGGGMPIFEATGLYAILRLPQIISLVIPMAGMLAAMSVYSRFHSHLEITAIMSSGIRLLRIVGVFIGGGIFLATLHFIFLNTVVLDTSEKLRIWANNDYREVTAQTNISRYPAWFTIDELILFAEDANDTGSTLLNIKLVERDKLGRLETYTTASKATYDANSKWILHDVTEKNLDSGKISSFKEHPINLNSTPEDLAVFNKKIDEMTLPELLALTTANHLTDSRNYYYDTWLQRRFSQPFSTLIMILIAVPLLFMSPRHTNKTVLSAGIIIIGFLFFVGERIALSFGEGGEFPPTLAVWLPSIIFGIALITYTLWKESRFSK